MRWLSVGFRRKNQHLDMEGVNNLGKVLEATLTSQRAVCLIKQVV